MPGYSGDGSCCVIAVDVVVVEAVAVEVAVGRWWIVYSNKGDDDGVGVVVLVP